MAEGTKGQEIKKSSTCGRRFTEPLTNVPNIPNFTCIVKDFETNQYPDLGVPQSFAMAFIPKKQKRKVKDSDNDLGTVVSRATEPILPRREKKEQRPSPLTQPRTLFDFAIFYADSRESEDEVIQFMGFVERLCRNSPKKPRIWASACDMDGLGSSYLEAVQYGLNNSNVYFLYIDKCFAHDKWATFQQDQCLHQYFQEMKVIVPVETIKNYQMPFALRVFRQLKPWRLINNIDGLSMKDFLDNAEDYWDACDKNYLEKMKTIFEKICAGDSKPLFLLE